MTYDALFELGTEELPSGAVLPLAEALAAQVRHQFGQANISYEVIHSFATPRRLAIKITGLPERQADQLIVRRGPAWSPDHTLNGQSAPALLGFAKSCGVTLDALTIVETEKGKWWQYEATSKGKNVRELIPHIINESLAALPIAKPMRWGDGDIEFARPIHWAVLMIGNEVIDANIYHIETTNQSYGHRFHHPQPVTISAPESYESALQDAFVIADFAKRRALIVKELEALAHSKAFTPVMPPELVDEVTSIVEWPVVLMGRFEEAFLEVPAEALIASLQLHQKCFALRDQHGHLVPYFLMVSNIQSLDPEQVISGNEKVVRARLSDAAFFFRQDKRQPLIDYRLSTKNVLFQAKLGTLWEKSERLYHLMRHWEDALHLHPEEVKRAAELSKCDLMTGMVGEFPELQGLMGYYYAKQGGEKESVAIALNEQYMPRFATDSLPTSLLGYALSLADRFDTLVGAFALGQKPTGVKDPFKLRRHALAVVRLLIQMPNAPLLSNAIQQSLLSYGNTLHVEEGAMEALRLFILERLYAFYEGQGIKADLVRAVRGREEENLFDLDKRLLALRSFVKLSEAASLSAACKRVTNLLQQAKMISSENHIDPNLLIEAPEQELYRQLVHTEKSVEPFFKTHDYQNALFELAKLRDSVDSFFDHVMVMVEDETQKLNRLALLSRLNVLLQGIADISLLELTSLNE